jgi:hypothetical protein
MTMSSGSNSPFDSALVGEELPAATSGGSCAGDGSVGSSSTSTNKTRFSFYNAEQVQLESAAINGVVITATRSDQGEASIETTTTTLSTHKAASAAAAAAAVTQGHDHQRCYFYDGDSAGASQQQQQQQQHQEDANKTEDDRRSPHTPLVTEQDSNDDDDNNNNRIPAVVNNSSNDNNNYNTDKTNLKISTTPTQASTPQRSNNSSSSSAQKKKQRAVQAAAARARNCSNSSGGTPVAKGRVDPKEEVVGKMDSVEILRSLKDTEEMRYNLMKECHPKNNQPQADSLTTSHEASEVFEDAAEHLSHDNDNANSCGQPDSQQHARQSATASDQVDSQQKARQRTTAAINNSTNSNISYAAPARVFNPYEDAIREALDLLRKHRPPSPQPASNGNHDPNTDGPKKQSLSIDMNVVHGAASNKTLQTPRDADRVMLSRWESPVQNPEEFDSRRKERQERLARYTTRLAELKNDEDAGLYSSVLNRPASTIEEEEGSILSSFSVDQNNNNNNNANLGASASFSSQQQRSPQIVGVPSVLSGGIPAACSGDMASLDTASSLSASNYNPQGNQKEVHRSVERVLLAILERAHSSGRASQGEAPIESTSPGAASQYSPHDHDSSWLRGGEEKKSPYEDQTSKRLSPQLTVEEDPLLRAVGELLSSSCGGSVLSGQGSHMRPSDTTVHSSSTSGATKRSVVEELLAEAESFCEQLPSEPVVLSEMRAADLLNCSTGVEAVRADIPRVEVDKELDELVLKTLGKSESKNVHRLESSSSDGGNTDYEEESQSPAGSYDHDDSYDEGEEEESDEDLEDALEGVLGPLSKRAGGTTGVVLESNVSPARSAGERSIFDSLSNAMSSLVASAISGDEKQSIPPPSDSNLKSCSGRDKYATGVDADEKDEEEIESVEQSSSGDDVDEEASELMRSLCAHLLPFGVDQSNRFLDEVPQWDDSNPTEAGYRIIRLTSQQLQRVERAFEAMVLGLKKNSEQDLIASSLPAVADIDGAFERDLATAEKVLNRDEESRTISIMKALKLVSRDGKVISPVTTTPGDDESAAGESVVAATPTNGCHPNFPGVHSAGKGEMGDLEYFHLPVIFKSHVTGFEPTKDLFLEPGNVVAGQFLVESELGSAAFSTAYRCVDLNSEGDDTEDVSREMFESHSAAIIVEDVF